MRFLGSILNNGTTLCHAGCKHNIDRRTDRNNIQINMVTDQRIGKGIDHTILDVDRGSQCTESLQMLVDRTASDIASARKGYLCLFIFAKKSSQ